MKKLVLLGLIAFIGALIVKTPASLISQQLEAQTEIRLHGVQGTLWEGVAAQLSVGKVTLGKLDWSVNPWSLLTGSLGGVLAIKGEALTVKGEYALSLGNTLALDAVQFVVDGGFINNVQNYGKVYGTFRGKIDHLEMPLDLKTPPVVAATINWEKGGLFSPVTLSEGNYQLKIEPEKDGKLRGVLISRKAPVDVKGFAVLDQNWHYQTDLKIKTNPQGENLKGMLSMLGRPQADGYIMIREQGQLQTLGGF